MTGKTFVFTGEFHPMTRLESAALVEAHGGEVSDRVHSWTNYLVAGKEAGSKLPKALALGVTVITPAILLEMARGGMGSGLPA